jgi:hypothetical protein
LIRANGESLARGDAYQALASTLPDPSQGGAVAFTIVAMSAVPGAIVEEIVVTVAPAPGAVQTPVPLIVRGGLVTEIGLAVTPPSPPATAHAIACGGRVSRSTGCLHATRCSGSERRQSEARTA